MASEARVLYATVALLVVVAPDAPYATANVPVTAPAVPVPREVTLNSGQVSYKS